MSGVEARRATLSDLEALVELRTEMFRAIGNHEIHRDWIAAATQWFTERIDHPDHCLRVVEVEGRVVAAALGSLSPSQPRPDRPIGWDLHISNVVTLPQYRGRGCASAAFQAVMDWGHAQPGPVRARLFATRDGRSMYERAGFRESSWPSMGVESV